MKTSPMTSGEPVRRGLLRRIVLLACVVGSVSVMAAMVATSLGAAAPPGPPTIQGSLSARDVQQTRVRLLLGFKAHEAITTVTFEYAQSEAGPWTIVATRTEQPNEEVGEASQDVTHLVPNTRYYARVTLKNEYGQTQETIQFSTLSVAAPQFENTANDTSTCPGGRNYVPQADLVCGEAGASVASFGFGLYTGGADTSWSAEYSTDKGKLERGEGTPIPGASGSITVDEEEAKSKGDLSGLTAETTYYLRVKASNEKGVTAPIVSFVTSAKPLAVIGQEDVAGITGSSALVQGNVNPREQETHWRFEYAAVKEAEEGRWTAGPGGVLPAVAEDDSYHKVEGSLSGLAPGTTYYVRLLAENSYGSSTASAYTGFETARSPRVLTFATHAIHNESMRFLGSTSLGMASSDITHYHFEYVPRTQFEASGFAGGTSTPAMALAGGKTREERIETPDGHTAYLALPINEIVGEDVPGLKSGETYEFRMVASNDEGAGEGAAHVLTMPSVAADGGEESCANTVLRTGPSSALPSCRAYEQVTPAAKRGAFDLFTWGLNGEQDQSLVGEDGNHVFFTNALYHPGSNAGVFDGAFFFSRAGEGLWTMTSATPQPETGFNFYEFVSQGLFNGDLTQVGFRSNWLTSTAHSPTETLMTGVPGGPYAAAASVPTDGGVMENTWAGASADFHTLILQTVDHKLLGTTTPTSSGKEDLYEYVEGHLRQVNVDTAGKTIGTCGAKLVRGYQGGEAETSGVHAVSADGSHVFFTASPGSTCASPGEEEGGGPNANLYMRVNGSVTVDIGTYGYVGATADGGRVLLVKPNGKGLEFLMYETGTGAFKRLFSVPVESLTLGVSGGMIVSDDLNMLYFGASQALTAEAPAVGNTESDVYVYDIPAGQLRFAFVITFPSLKNTYQQGPYMSPDGSYFYWRSEGNPGIAAPTKRLSENGAIENRPSAQLYRYDRIGGSVECVSCASPYDPEPLVEALTEADDAQKRANSVNGVPTIRIASDDGGRVFFGTAAALVAQDINGEVPIQSKCPEACEYPKGSPSLDVYEWRRPGLDGCGRIQGCVSLVSGGREGLHAQLLGTTPSGSDVFFATHEALVAQDTDSMGDIYDARIGGGEAPPAPRPTECEGDACSSPFSVPSDLTPASATFESSGNRLQAPVLADTVKRAVKKPKHKQRGRRAHRRRVRRARKAGGTAHARSAGRAVRRAVK